MEGLLHAYCRPTALELAPFGTYFGSSDPQSLFIGSELGLQERAMEWLGQQCAAFRYLQLCDMIY